MSYIGIDLGTSFLKGAVLDVDALAIRHVEREPFPDLLPDLPPLYREADPKLILERVEALLDRLWTHAPDCEGLLLCTQMHGLVLVAREGEPLSNYLSWADQRASGACFEEVERRVTLDQRRQLGREFRASVPLAMLFWFREQGLLPEGEVFPVSLGEFVAARLCRTLPVFDPTEAAACGAVNLETLGWHQEVLRALGLDGLRWPEIRPSGSVAGRWRSLPCYAAVGDQQCALAGSLLAQSELSLNLATGSQAAMISPVLEFGNYTTRPYFDGRFLKTITHIPGGRALNALIGLLSELAETRREDPWPYIQEAVAGVPETDLRAHIAFYPGPCGDHGSLENLHESNMTIGHVFRAAFESMAANYQLCAERLAPRESWSTLVFSG
ncbi:MAG TPA: FGGY family carbohydrate kinase, partial [Bryobacteraceae bacterium]|nr:FGGY family carbohydrate kinase [Bryobacteraceae bacterium]